GAEGEISYRLEQRWSLDAKYLFNQSVVGSFAADPTIVGKLPPQVPKHRTSARVLYSHPKWADASVEGRYESYRFDDSQNQRKLGSYLDRKSTRLNSSHVAISYAVFCLK